MLGPFLKSYGVYNFNRKLRRDGLDIVQDCADSGLWRVGNVSKLDVWMIHRDGVVNSNGIALRAKDLINSLRAVANKRLVTGNMSKLS